MFKDFLQQQQSTVYRILTNALKNKQLSHCYLFSGPKGTLKKETAFLLAQSLICPDADPWACENCINCQRISENNYVDLIYLDGKDKTIKIDQIEKLQSQFEKTALEAAGKKIFIIDHCDNMTAKAANSLLKFIEEPVGEITGIFITEHLDRVLSTIVSRCQTINFKPLSKDAFYKEAQNLKLDVLTSHFIANMVSSISDIEPLSKKNSFNNATVAFSEFMNSFFQDRKEAILYLQNKFSKLNKSDKANSRETFRYFIDLALLFVSDFLNDYTINDENYANLLTKAKEHQFNYAKFLNVMVETRDNFNKNGNGLLLIDQMLYKLMEV